MNGPATHTLRLTRRALLAGTAAAAVLASLPAFAADEPPELAEAVGKGDLPPMAERLPERPRVVDFAAAGREPGRYGGTLRLLMAESDDIRMMTIYGYARLVGFDEKLNLVADVLDGFDVEDGRIFTLRLRPGHKWSDGQPFTAEDFRYYWEDMATNEKVSRGGPAQEMLVDGERPVFEILDPLTVRYTWPKPNPQFLPSLAGARPNVICVPSHYLRQFHERYAVASVLALKVKDAGVKDWVALHTRLARSYRPENPKLPTLDPWVNTTPPPSERFVFRRNPYFHRVDPDGRQLPYIGEVVMTISSEDIIPAKTGSGESDLQARYLRFDNYTFLKSGEAKHNYTVDLWRNGTGSQVTYLPNLNVNDPVWRALMRDVRFRRALSLAINRHEINQQFYFGLAHEGSNTMMDASPLYEPGDDQAWAKYDPAEANRLLDEIGLPRDDDGFRTLPDGRRADLIVEMTGGNEETDVTELVMDYWNELGIKVFTRGLGRDNLRRRFLAGETMMSVWTGLNVGMASPELSPEELAPVSSAQGNWPKWGQHQETDGKAGEPVDDPAARKLQDLYRQWRVSATREERKQLWTEMLDIFTDQVFTIGTVNGVLQPIVIRATLRNVPRKAVYAFAPVAYFGSFLPDTFWFSE